MWIVKTGFLEKQYLHIVVEGSVLALFEERTFQVEEQQMHKSEAGVSARVCHSKRVGVQGVPE